MFDVYDVECCLLYSLQAALHFFSCSFENFHWWHDLKDCGLFFLMSMVEFKEVSLSRFDGNFVLFFPMILKILSSPALLFGMVKRNNAIFANFGSDFFISLHIISIR